MARPIRPRPGYDKPSLPYSATQPGWPEKIFNDDGTWYWRGWDGDVKTKAIATYFRMLSQPGDKANYDGTYLYLPMENQVYGEVAFERTPFPSTLPDNATTPE